MYGQGPFCPKEIKKMAKNADSSERSVLFEAWLQAEGNWAKSSLLVRLRSREGKTKRGLRRWMFKTDMITKFGEAVATMMIEAKVADPERSKTRSGFILICRRTSRISPGCSIFCLGLPHV